MKRLIPSAIIAILIVAACCFGGIASKKICNDAANEIKMFKTAFSEGNTEYALTLTNNFEEKWQNTRKPILAIFVNHSFLDEISDNTARISSLCRYNEYAEFYAECAQLENIIKQIIEESTLSWESFY